jgi:hypothetical protein
MTYETCPGCAGNGVQKRDDGIMVVCPICNGCGRWYKPALPDEPFNTGTQWQPDRYVVTCTQPAQGVIS